MNAAKAAGLRAIGWHTLRHTFASHLVMGGVPLAHLSPSIKLDAVNVLDAREQQEAASDSGG